MYGGGRGRRGGNYGRRGGYRGGSGGFSRGGRGRGRAAAAAPAAPEKPTAPRWIKLEKLMPSRSAFILVKVGEIKEDASMQLYKGQGRVVNIPCTQVLVGDETGHIYLNTQQADLAAALKANEGKVVGLMNVKMRSISGSAYIEAEKFSTVKTLEQLKEKKDENDVTLLPEDTNTNFDINRDLDRSKRQPKKPTWVKLSEVNPDRKGLNLIVQVVEANVEEKQRMNGEKVKTAAAVVGDATGCFKLLVRHDSLVDVLKAGENIAIFNAHVEMIKNTFMQLVADKWSSIKPISGVPSEVYSADDVPKEVKKEHNWSDAEWVLQES